jgi:hypothetical protein
LIASRATLVFGSALSRFRCTGIVSSCSPVSRYSSFLFSTCPVSWYYHTQCH